MAEWPNAPVLKTGVGSNLPWVQIPPSPLSKGLTPNWCESFSCLCPHRLCSPAFRMAPFPPSGYRDDRRLEPVNSASDEGLSGPNPAHKKARNQQRQATGGRTTDCLTLTLVPFLGRDTCGLISGAAISDDQRERRTHGKQLNRSLNIPWVAA